MYIEFIHLTYQFFTVVSPRSRPVLDPAFVSHGLDAVERALLKTLPSRMSLFFVYQFDPRGGQGVPSMENRRIYLVPVPCQLIKSRVDPTSGNSDVVSPLSFRMTENYIKPTLHMFPVRVVFVADDRDAF